MSSISSGITDARGVKRLCASCAVPFYDLARTPIICPNCSETFEPPPVVVLRTEPARAHNARRTAPWTSQRSAQLPQPVAVSESAASTIPNNDAPSEAKSTTDAVADDDDVLLELDQEDDGGDVESDDADAAKDQPDS